MQTDSKQAREEETMKFSFKEIAAMTLALYKMLIPKAIALLISLCVVAFIMKLYFGQ